MFACLLIAIGAWAYSNSFAGVLIGDDDAAIAQNTSIRSLWPLSGPLSPPTDTTVAGRPVANVTFAVSYALAGGTTDLRGYHAFNLVVHLLAGLSLFGVVRRTLLTPALRDRCGGAAAPLAFVVSAIWIAHPLHTQAVTFLAQRVESLMGFFYLATLYCAIRAAETDFRNRAWMIGAVVLCALGMGTKETMITAPVMVALWIWGLQPRAGALKASRPLLIGLAATMAIAVALAAVIAALVLVIQAASRPLGRRADMRLAWMLAAIVVPLGVVTRDRNRVYASAEAMAADTVANRPQNALARLAYGGYLVEQKRFTEADPHLRAAVELPLSPSTDESKSRSLAHLYLGMSLLGRNNADEGSRELEQAIAARPDLDRAYPLLAEAQLSQKRAAAAVATLDRALARRPDDAALTKRLAWILATSSDSAVRSGERAVQYAERAVQLTESRDPVALDVLAAAHAESGQFDQALAALARAVDIVRASGPNDLVPTLRDHLGLFEARRPVRAADW